MLQAGVLVTLGGCHLLDGLVARGSVEARKKIVRCSGEASPHKRRLKCDTKHQSQEADATFITSDGSKPYKPWRTLDTDNDNN